MDPVEASAIVPRLRFRQENEVKLNYSARITEAEWERHAEAVKHMHEQRKTRREILETLHNDHEFCPSMAQLNMHMKKWKLRVYGGGNAEPVERADDEALQAADVAAGADELPASTSLPAPQNNGTSDLQQMENLEPDSTTRDKVLVRLSRDEQDRGPPRVPEVLVQATVTIPAHDLPDLSPLNLDPIISDDVETSNDTTSLTRKAVAMPSSRQREVNSEQLGGFIPEPGSDRNMAMPEAEMHTEDAIIQFGQGHCVGSNHYTALRTASVCSLMTHQSDGSSLRAFRHFAGDVARDKQLRRKDSQQSLRALTIMSEDSWDFSLVTGMPSGYPSPSGRQLPEDTGWRTSRWDHHRLRYFLAS